MNDHFTIETADHHQKLFLELHKLQQQRVACDVAIAAEDGEISAHRIILMSASKYFRKKIIANMHEKNPRIYLQGTNVYFILLPVRHLYNLMKLLKFQCLDYISLIDKFNAQCCFFLFPFSVRGRLCICWAHLLNGLLYLPLEMLSAILSGLGSSCCFIAYMTLWFKSILPSQIHVDIGKIKKIGQCNIIL